MVLTANTNNYGQITLNTKPHSDPLLRSRQFYSAVTSQMPLSKVFSFFETKFGRMSIKCFHDKFDCHQNEEAVLLLWKHFIDVHSNLISKNEKKVVEGCF